ncbi:group III truncated hemoglobin [Ciceribacter sp. RN22]|uniref:group III truncated hemoglobin n=1 Tax=Ciceribacter sp. RN22 TaxID=2954932 RepID=UPI002093AC9A|nr:truncated hemoglobin [Ciceribacter sp. RN22]MCO6176853.1 truncated hemoglobin [Ciceribacter sp. RN22]
MTIELTARAAHVAGIRERAQAEMERRGVNAAFIDLLVETFYGRIRAHEHLGPVFEHRLAGRWPDHLAKMKSFWSSVAFKTGTYGGKPVQAHLGVEGVYEGVFAEWLTLFRATLDDIAPSEEAAQWFMATAERIARSLVLAMFYNPALDDPANRRLTSTQ